MTKENSLPKGWEKVEIVKYLELVKSGVKEFTGIKTYIATGSLKSGKVIDFVEINFETKPSRANMEVQINDVVFAKMKDTEKVFLVSEKEIDNIFSTGFSILRVKNKEKVNSKFLFYWLKSRHFQNMKNKECTGATQKAINETKLNKFNLILPPLPTQMKIAAILEKAEQLKEWRKEADELTEEFLRSTFLEMFGDPLKNPKGWKKVPFGKVCQTRLGKMLDKKKQTGLYSKPYLRNANVLWGKLDLSDIYEMDFDEKERNEFLLKKGDILICEGGEIGRTAIWNNELSECYFQKALHRARPFPNITTAEFIVYLMLILGKCNGFRNFTSKSTIAHLTGVKLKSFPIIIPPFPLQQKFTQIVNKVENIQKGQENSSIEINNLFNMLMQQAFKGELAC